MLIRRKAKYAVRAPAANTTAPPKTGTKVRRTSFFEVVASANQLGTNHNSKIPNPTATTARKNVQGRTKAALGWRRGHPRPHETARRTGFSARPRIRRANRRTELREGKTRPAGCYHFAAELFIQVHRVQAALLLRGLLPQPAARAFVLAGVGGPRAG